MLEWKKEDGERREGKAKLRLPRLYDFATLDAAGTNAHSLGRAFNKGAHALEVHIPAAIRNVVGVTHTMAKLRSTTAEFTGFCH